MMYLFAFIGILVCVWFVSDLLSKDSAMRKELSGNTISISDKSISKGNTRIVREDGIYITYINTVNEFADKYMVMIIFFVEKYMCFEWDQVNERIEINSDFLNHMFQWRNEIYTAIQNGEISASEAMHKFAPYRCPTSYSVEARFMDDAESLEYKDLTLTSGPSNSVFLTAEANSLRYDFSVPENSGFKKIKVCQNQALSFFNY